MGLLIKVGVLAGGVIVLALGVVVMMFAGLWVRARTSGVPVSFCRLVTIKLRRLHPETMVDSLITLWKAGVDVEMEELEALVLAGGHLGAVVDAAIAAEKADLQIDFQQMAAIDLAGRNVADAIESRVKPKVLLCPPRNSPTEAISGVARDGIRLSVKARITVRTKIDALVGGAGDQTVIARVGEGIVTAIGRAESHRDILERPEIISQQLLDSGLDRGTCFEILSVDVADVDVKDNIASRLRSSQAAADKRIAQAHAEIRRAAAVAEHQEMKAKTVESYGHVAAAKSLVPLAVASSFGEANLGRRLPLQAAIDTRVRWRRKK